ncbi:unnamed protein product [Mytilus edulis]|uniref:Uncharacterized protein n=1 Tax=Mytilus edulis TaxID=6550 RepID=A0A8S3RI54_MYTED|nr:unnamed protein product [Mytilus edulis]
MTPKLTDEKRDDFINTYFGDLDDGSDFEGFDLNDYMNNSGILREKVSEQDIEDINVLIDEAKGWSKIDEPPFSAPFTGTPDLNDIDMGEDSQPIDYFNLLFKNSMWETIVEQSNLYVERRLQTNTVMTTQNSDEVPELIQVYSDQQLASIIENSDENCTIIIVNGDNPIEHDVVESNQGHVYADVQITNLPNISADQDQKVPTVVDQPDAL